MKKLAIYLSIILVLFALLYFIDRQTKNAANEMYSDEAQQLYSTSPGELNEATRKQLENPDYQNIILPAELQKKLDNEEDAYVYFFSPLCPFCVATTPVLNELADDAGVDIRQYNVLEFEQAWSEYALEATPTLIYFEGGQVVDSVVGGYSGNDAEQDAAAEAAYIEFFEKHNSES